MKVYPDKIVIFLSIIFFSVSLFSQKDIKPEQLKVLRKSMEKGFALFKEEKYKEAIKYFLKAYKIYQTPSLIWNIARTYEESGEIEKAIHFFELYIEQNTGSEYENKARKKIKKLKEQLFGYLTLEIKPEGALIEIDGKEVGKSPQRNIKLKKGKYRISASMKGYKTWEKDIEIVAKQNRYIEVELSKISVDKNIVIAKSEPVISTNWKTWAIISAGISGGFLATGIIFHMLSISEANDLNNNPRYRDRIEGSEDDKRFKSEWDKVKNKMYFSYICYGVSGVAAIISTYLFLTSSDRPKSKSSGLRFQTFDKFAMGYEFIW